MATDESADEKLFQYLESKKKRGAQPGNRNALKHGLYSRLLLPDEKKSLKKEGHGELDDEIELIRAYLFRTAKFFKENPPAKGPEYLVVMRTLTAAVTCLQGSYRTQKAVFDKDIDLVDEFFRLIELDPEEEGKEEK
jgi:hypothetical protein